MATKYKLKSHKGLLKRIRITGSGKVKFRKIHNGHLRSVKSGQRIIKLRRKNVAKAPDILRLERMLNMRLTPADAQRPAAAAEADAKTSA